MLARGPFRGGVDRDLAVTGALLHDIGKTEVYSTVNGAIQMTDRGKLLGEIPSGTTRSAARSSGSTAFRPPRPRVSSTSS